MTELSNPSTRETEAEAETEGVSEFLSETSEEYRALRRASPSQSPERRAVEAREAKPAAEPAVEAAPSAPTPVAVPAAATRVEPARVPAASPETPVVPPRAPIERRPVVVTPVPAAYTGASDGPRPRRRAVPWGWLVAAIALAVGVTAWPLLRGRSEPTTGEQPSPTHGVAIISSRPEGAEVWIAGERRGTTPLQLRLAAGTHSVEVRNGAASRILSLAVAPNVWTRESVELAPAVDTGAIDIVTDRPGAQVTVDGVARGVTPAVVTGLAPGDHTVVVTAAGTSMTRVVRVSAGATATVMASVAPSGSTGGFLTVAAPFEMQVFDAGRLVGITSADRLMLPLGTRDLEFVAEPYEFRTRVTVAIQPGRTTTVPVTVPNGRLSINAIPWAEVWLDGVSLGATPLANIEASVGPHQVVYRHPSLGERRETVRVSALTPARASVTFTAAP
jgi:hypothetical protein